MTEHARLLIDRYVYAIQRLLPRAQRDDIASELREILHSQVDDAEARTQRSLDNEEIHAILRRFGQPRDVASRYGSPQYLIGPEVFPSYVVAVKVVLWVLLPLTLFMVLVTALTAGENLLSSLLHTLWSALNIGLLNLGIVTLMFVYFGRASAGNLHADDWDLDDLPEVPADPNAPVPRSERFGSLVGLVLMLCWWLGLNTVARRFFGWDPLPIVWAPVWAHVTAAAVSIIVACIARELIGLARPHWIRSYLLSGAILDFGALLVLLRLLTSNTYVAAADRISALGAVGSFVSIFNTVIFVGLIVMSLGVAGSSIHAVWRLLHVPRLPFRANTGIDA